MKRTTGTATFHDLEGYLNWYRQLSMEDAKVLYEQVFKKYENEEKREHKDPVTDKLVDMYKINTVKYWEEFESSLKKDWEQRKQQEIAIIKEFMSYATAMEQPLMVRYWLDNDLAFLTLHNPKKGILVLNPDLYLTFDPEPDYKALPVSQIRQQLSVGTFEGEVSLVPKELEHASLEQMEVTLQEQALATKAIEDKINAVKKNEAEELADLTVQIERLQRELQERKETLMEELERQKAAMEQELRQMEGQIYRMDSQIYAIRCYAGETVQFKQLRSGKNASDTYPIVIHQKLRYLDEELGRLASLYDIQWEDMDLFEQFLVHAPQAMDTFAPNDRCVVLVRLSRSGKNLGEFHEAYYQNLLRRYDYYHGKTVGIIIRNGDNLYLGWTDEERIKIDDDLIATFEEYKPEAASEFETTWDKERRLKKEQDAKQNMLEGILSRTFVYHILQGIVDHSDMIPLPDGVVLSQESEYVKYSMAERWLADNRFGSFTDIIHRGNQLVTKGDAILTVQRLVPERMDVRDYQRPWMNVRGRGDANRTYDVVAKDCTIYPVNLVEYDEPVEKVRYRYPLPTSSLDKNGERRYSTYLINKEQVDRLSEDCQILEEFIHTERHIFISLPKKYCDARANFEVYEEEFINLQYLNTVWLEWVITNKTLGDWRVGGESVDYAYAIRYLRTAIEYVRKEELAMKAYLDDIDETITTHSDWPVWLSEWRMEHHVRQMNGYQARRFVKYFHSKKK